MADNSKKKNKTPQQRIQLEGEPSICSLKNLQVLLPQDIRDHLDGQDGTTTTTNGSKKMDQILEAMKIPPAATVCRVNLIQGTREEIQAELEAELKRLDLQDAFSVQPDSILDDVLQVVANTTETPTKNLHLAGPVEDPQAPLVFPTWPSRQTLGWPLKHRAVIVDRFCGEAVLRGSHIFVKGIMCADKGIQEGETIAVYADVRSTISKNRRIKRGYFLEQYRNRLCVYLGLGVAMFQRSDFFRLEKGVGIRMTPHARVGPMLPPISGILPSKVYFQNLPSVLVARALDPKPGHVIIDMCAAPGGKTNHVASLVRNNATIVACDKSRKKMIAAQQMFRDMGATCITALALNTTDCVVRDNNSEWQSVTNVLNAAQRAPDGLLDVTGFYPESFDRVLLDPPCSALGLRPKLQVVHTKLAELQDACAYQRKFIREAVQLLKPGGIMTYSTCTFNADENERMVRHILSEYETLELLPVLGGENSSIALGQPGLAGMGLNDEERGYVRRFDPLPSEAGCDTIGFFVAKFRKRQVS
ncbi:Putative methyltransferase NSUN6 [Seminavis robusta]|uniref:Methyltransferase NSUN6 n=1 Tax=Seminavis robusta TaxID=568900 RepID=A0A9N8DCH1_9STRA|nr:Putative methyltransferase NSUN6 [Seminavis robusta]|eukprot:Sro59_g034400.1 Putative methyltransferase NSUN6 (531) ;mRNA; f:133580-135172